MRYNVVLTFQSVGEILKCDYSKELQLKAARPQQQTDKWCRICVDREQ